VLLFLKKNAPVFTLPVFMISPEEVESKEDPDKHIYLNIPHWVSPPCVSVGRSQWSMSKCMWQMKERSLGLTFFKE